MLGRTADALIARFGWRQAVRLLVKLRLARVVPAGKTVAVGVPGLKAPVQLRARTSDAQVLKELLVRGDYDGVWPAAPRFIVDAGANIGLVSVLFAARYPDARIVALEIDAANFELLKRNAQPYANVTALNAGLWSRATQLVVANPDAREWAFRARESNDAAPTAVPAFSVTDLMRRFEAQRVDILKVDIEGGEVEVFGPEADRWVDDVNLIAIELHDRLVPHCEEVVAARLRGRFTRRRAGELDVFERVPRAR